MYLLDTNVVSELRKAASGKADANVAAWASRVDASELFISAITVMEIEMGVMRIERRDATLPVDTAVARRCARLHVPDMRSERDALIAATALTHCMTVVTRNTADFAPTGVPLINPWEPRQ